MDENTHTSDPKAKNLLQLTIGTRKNIDSNIEILMQKRKEINQRRVPAQSGNFNKKKMHQSHVSVLFGRSVDCNNFLARS